MKKYRITEEVNDYDSDLHRIEALKSFGDVKRGDLGGWIEKESNLSQKGTCWIYNEAKVYGDAKIYEDAKLYDNAKAYENARLWDNVELHDDARILGQAKAFDNAKIYNNVTLSDYSVASGDSKIYGDVQMYSFATVQGKATVQGNVYLSNDTVISEDAVVTKTPLQVQGTRHHVNINGDKLQIGCQLYSIDSWLEHFKKIGKAEGYTDKQIKEYKLYIDLAKKLSEL